MDEATGATAPLEYLKKKKLNKHTCLYLVEFDPII